MAGFAFALALDANEIHVEMQIELRYSLSRYRESYLTTINLIQGSSSSLMAGFASTLALDTNEIQIEKHIELCYS